MSFQNTVKRIMADRSNEPGWRKPHLRLHYVTSPLLNDVGNPYPWYVAYVSGPSNRVRHATYHHTTSNGALNSARVIWWGVSL